MTSATEPLLAATHHTKAGPFNFIAGPDRVCAADFADDLAL